MRKRPSFFNIGAAGIAVVGIWLVSVTTSGQTFSIGFGDRDNGQLGFVCGSHRLCVQVHRKARRTDAHGVPIHHRRLFRMIVGAVTETLPTGADEFS